MAAAVNRASTTGHSHSGGVQGPRRPADMAGTVPPPAARWALVVRRRPSTGTQPGWRCRPHWVATYRSPSQRGRFRSASPHMAWGCSPRRRCRRSCTRAPLTSTKNPNTKTTTPIGRGPSRKTVAPTTARIAPPMSIAPVNGALSGLLIPPVCQVQASGTLVVEVSPAESRFNSRCPLASVCRDGPGAGVAHV